MTSKQRVVVIGGGMAGARLVQQLGRAADAPGRSGHAVTVIGEERHAPYNRVLLAEVLAGQYTPDVIALPAPGPDVRRLTGVRAVRVDRDERRVVCDDGGVVAYDALVLATGSNPVLPPVRGLFDEGGPGAEAGLPDGVHPFRTLDDCAALAAAAGPGTRAVVIGGGLLGVSAARALAARGAQTVLAHQGEHLMERHLDATASDLLRTHLTGLGVEVHTECRVRGLGTGRDARTGHRTVRSVTLADGYALDTDLVVLACGVRPRTGLAHAAGLTVGRGVVVDDELRTDDPHIFAVGDCAEHRGTVYGLAGPAQEQADALAAVLLGRDTATPRAAPSPTAPPAPARAGGPYTGTRALTRLTLAGPGPLDLAAFGETVPRPDDDVVHLADATRGAYRKVVVRGDRLVGGILLGDLGTVGALARTWEGDEPLPSAPLLHLLTNDGGL
ncbi:FAD-dependent oxidoreductase [Streptomyces chumphonensis]|uniref:NAD(P)/FAD-dependent oxidoreductase n=1 Tax=Streptomyces chumphonensis TaxID=1214925 RepID=A0A927EWF2_9ACTN|nr:FAD-dependent oxidoreductase [Streptomyces chumphonensis]MBD3930650.1 NAD(P)/FAD-dependent oxidoreductase [Streptomyces chumphonensis]